jgi:hypothetical protein
MFKVPNWKPRSELDNSKPLFVDGIPYQFTVLEISEHANTNLNRDELVVKSKIEIQQNRFVTHQFSLPLDEGFLWKTASFFDSIGAGFMWDKNEIDFNACRDRIGQVIFSTKEYIGKKDGLKKTYQGEKSFIKKELQTKITTYTASIQPIAKPKPSDPIPSAQPLPFDDDISF